MFTGNSTAGFLHSYLILSQKNQNKRECLTLFGFSMTMQLTRKVPDVTKEQIYVYHVYAISR